MSDTVMVNGKEFGPSSDFRPVLRSQLLAMSGLAEKHDLGPETGIRRLFDATRGTLIESALIDAVMDLLVEPNVEVRTGIVRILKQYPESFDPRQLIEALKTHPELFRGVAPSKGSDPDLEWGILRAVAGHPSQDPVVLRRLREAALDSDRGTLIIGGLAISDPKWVVSHGSQLVAGDPTRAAAILVNLDSPSDRQDFVRLAGSEPRSKSAVASAVVDHIKDPIERKQLIALIP